MLLTLDLAVTDRLRAAQEDYHRSRVIGQHDMTLLYQELWHQFDEVERARGHRFLTRQRPVTPVTRFEYLEPLRLAQNEELIDEQGIRALLNFSAPAPSPTADPWNNGVSQSAVGPAPLPVEESVEDAGSEDYTDTVPPAQGIASVEDEDAVYYSAGAANVDWSDYDDDTENEDDESEGTSAEYTEDEGDWDDEDGSSEGWDDDNEDGDEETFVEQPDDLYDEDSEDEEVPTQPSRGIAPVYDDPDDTDDDSDEGNEDEGDDEGTEDWYDDPEEDESYLEEPAEVVQPAPLPEVKQSQVTTSAYEVPTNLRDFIKEYPGCSMQDALKYFSARDVNKQIRLGRVVNRQGRLYL